MKKRTSDLVCRIFEEFGGDVKNEIDSLKKKGLPAVIDYNSKKSGARFEITDQGLLKVVMFLYLNDEN